MKNLYLLMLLTLTVGDCALLVGGVFKGQYWIVTAVNEGGTFDIYQSGSTLKNVRGSYLEKVQDEKCREVR